MIKLFKCEKKGINEYLGVEPYRCFTVQGLPNYLFYCTDTYLYGCNLPTSNVTKIEDFQSVPSVLRGLLTGKLKINKVGTKDETNCKGY